MHNLCLFSPTCGNAVALEHNGDLYSCDYYVKPAYQFQIRELKLVASSEAARVRTEQTG